MRVLSCDKPSPIVTAGDVPIGGAFKTNCCSSVSVGKIMVRLNDSDILLPVQRKYVLALIVEDNRITTLSDQTSIEVVGKVVIEV